MCGDWKNISIFFIFILFFYLFIFTYLSLLFKEKVIYSELFRIPQSGAEKAYG